MRFDYITEGGKTVTQDTRGVLPTPRSTGSFLRWDDNERYEQGFYIGSSGENGEHFQHVKGWPYSIYRKAAQPGVSDIVICNGIQCFEDAFEIAQQIMGLA